MAIRRGALSLTAERARPDGLEVWECCILGEGCDPHGRECWIMDGILILN